MQMATAPSSAQPRALSDLTSLNSVPSPRKPQRSSGNGPQTTPTDSVTPVL
jgi:hypothetical protein